MQRLLNITSRLFGTAVSSLAKTLLFIMGWSFLNKRVLTALTESKRTILVFSHTSYADFYILILYLLSYPTELANVRTLVKPQPFKHFGGLLRRLGAIPATKIEDKQGGAVDRIVTDLKQTDQSIFLISPKGTILKREWRSGYYHIGKALKADFRVAGLDYEHHRVSLSDTINHEMGEERVREFLQAQLTDIVPLHPENEVVTIRSHYHSTLVDHDHMIMMANMVLVCALFSYMHEFTTISYYLRGFGYGLMSIGLLPYVRLIYDLMEIFWVEG